MKARILLLPLLLLFILAFTQCAKRGRPSGGPLDSIPPKPLHIVPKNYQTNFTEKTISIYFDEYIRLDKLQENLIISPPMENDPIITPYSVSRTLEIQIEDTLQPGTTYTFNFGNSIVDNNEANVLEQFKYVFSTGDHIDSLEINGKVIDSRLLELKKKATVNLYRLDETYHDSIIHKGKPSYVSVTDEDGRYHFSNLAEGKYLLAAIQKGKEGNPYTYDQENDKFAFYPTPIQVPSDSIYNLDLYRAYPNYRLSRPEMENEGVIRFGYRGDGSIPKIEMLDKPEATQTRTIKEIDKDSLYFWYQPSIEKDSLSFRVSYKDTSETLRVRVKEDMKVKEYKLSKIDTKTPLDTFKLRGSTPLIAVNKDAINLINQDSISVPFEVSIDKLDNTVAIDFHKDYESSYQMQLFPGAITDWQEETNDTLQHNVRIKSESEYGSLHVNILGIKAFPVRVDLLNESSKIVRSVYLKEQKEVDFLYLNKGTYFVRVSSDLNKNGKWDPGDFATRKQPEPVHIFHIPIEIHANWSVKETMRMP